MSTKPRFNVGQLVATTRLVLGYDWFGASGDGARLPDLPTGTTVRILEAKRIPGSGWRYRTRTAESDASGDYWVNEDAIGEPLLVTR